MHPSLLKYFLPEEKPELYPYCVTRNFLSKTQCDEIIDEGLKEQLDFAQIGIGKDQPSQQDLNYRTVKATSLVDQKWQWLYQKLYTEMHEVNKLFEFDLTGLLEPIQFLRYEMPHGDVPPGHYHWHQDYGGGFWSRRKISVVINLSDPATYKGCGLDIFTNQVSRVTEIEPGTMITFPSYIPHQVTNIEEGTRHALVTWVHGPRFR